MYGTACWEAGRTDRQASVPEDTKRTISTLGTRSMTMRARTFCAARMASSSRQLSWHSTTKHYNRRKRVHTSSSHGAPKLAPFCSCLMITSLTSSLACPTMAGPQLPT